MKKIKFERFCMMTFVGFYLWTFEQNLKGVCQESIEYFLNEVFGLLFYAHIRKNDLQLGSKSNGKKSKD
jgi:hypothetical protein